MFIAGTGCGAAINILILSSKLKGSGKQLCIYQGIFKVTGVITVALLLTAVRQSLCHPFGVPESRFIPVG